MAADCGEPAQERKLVRGVSYLRDGPAQWPSIRGMAWPARPPKRAPQNPTKHAPARAAPQPGSACGDPKNAQGSPLEGALPNRRLQGAGTRAKCTGEMYGPSVPVKRPVTSLQRLAPNFMRQMPAPISAALGCGAANSILPLLCPLLWSSAVGLRGGPETRLPRVACRIELHGCRGACVPFEDFATVGKN